MSILVVGLFVVGLFVVGLFVVGLFVVGLFVVGLLFNALGANVVGLLFDALGAILLAKLLIKSNSQIKDLSSYYVCGAVFIDEGCKKMINEELVKSFKTDRNYGIIGITCLVIGFTLQIIGNCF